MKAALSLEFPVNGASIHHDLRATLTTRYLAPGRAKSFALTQESVIDKRPAFSILIDALKGQIERLAPGTALRVLDLGCGVPFFLNSLLAGTSGMEFALEYTGIDISKDMIESFRSLVEPAPHCLLELNLHSGINVPIEGFERALPAATTTPFDAIVSMQFSHYFPTERCSLLWDQFEAFKLKPLTKPQYWQLCSSYLRPGGVFADFDDVRHEDPAEHQRLEEAWDRYGLERLTNERFLSSLASKEPVQHNQIMQLYVSGLSTGKALGRYRDARLTRRRYDCEEIATKQFVTNELSKIFGSLETHRHASLQNFYLWIAHKG